MNYPRTPSIVWGLQLVAVVLFAAQTGLGYATYGDGAGTAAAHMRADVDAFGAYWTGSGVPQNNPACADKKLDADNDVDVADFGVFHGCFNGPNRPAASPRCYQSTPPSSGTFALHGRPVDVLPDGHTLLFVRARFYDLKHGRWLQRDPTGFADGGNLYEAFGNNALRFSDPTGTEIWATARRYKTEVDGVPVWAVDYHINRNGIDLGIGGLVYPNAVDRRHFRTEYYPFTEDLRTIARYDTMIESGRQIYEELAILGEEIAAYEKAIRVSATAAVGLPVAAVAAPAASAAFSTTAVGITTTTLGGNVAAASLTGAVSLGSGSAVAEGLVGGDARQIALAGLQGAAIGGVTGGILGTALPTGTFSAVTTEGQAVVVTAIRTGPTPGAGSTQPRLIHLTSEESFAHITESGQLVGRHGIFAAPEGIITQGTALRSIRTLLMPANTVHTVPIPEQAIPLFQRPFPVGAYSGWHYLMGTRFAPPGIIDLSSGVFAPGETIIGPRVLIYGPDALLYGGAAGYGGLQLYLWNADDSGGVP